MKRAYKPTLIKWNFIVIFVFLSFLLVACNGKREYDAMRIVEKWEGKEIVFPDSLPFMRYGIDTVNFSIGSGYKILVYVDSIGCASCKMQLEEWNRFISYMDSTSSKSCQYLFFIHTRNPKELSYMMKNAKFEIPVCIDRNDLLNKKNHFPDNILFQTFLLNSENKVVYIGNPIYSSAIRELYEDVLIKHKQIDKENPEIIIEPTKVNLGLLSFGEEKIVKFEIKNNSNKLLIIENISTTCDCTSIEFDKKPVLSGNSLQVKVTIKPKETGFFSQAVIVKTNICKFINLQVFGHVND